MLFRELEFEGVEELGQFSPGLLGHLGEVYCFTLGMASCALLYERPLQWEAFCSLSILYCACTTAYWDKPSVHMLSIHCMCNCGCVQALCTYVQISLLYFTV